MTNKELKKLIAQFLALNPTYEQIETFYTNEVLPHDNRSIIEIMTRHFEGMTRGFCWACGENVKAMADSNWDTWTQCESIWVSHMDDREMPDGFYDSTYRNDVCPSIAHDSGQVYIWFHDKSTWNDMIGDKIPMVKYQVVAHPTEQVYGDVLDDWVLTDTNDWDEVIQAINTWKETRTEEGE
jgi:hypothetical protein